jgi:hypothetical protein
VALVTCPGHCIHVRSACIDLRVHIGYLGFTGTLAYVANSEVWLTLHQLECPDRLAKLFTMVNILNRIIEGRLH